MDHASLQDVAGLCEELVEAPALGLLCLQDVGQDGHQLALQTLPPGTRRQSGAGGRLNLLEEVVKASGEEALESQDRGCGRVGWGGKARRVFPRSGGKLGLGREEGGTQACGTAGAPAGWASAQRRTQGPAGVRIIPLAGSHSHGQLAGDGRV